MTDHGLARLTWPPASWDGQGNFAAYCRCGYFTGRPTEAEARRAIAEHAADPDVPDRPSWMVSRD